MKTTPVKDSYKTVIVGGGIVGAGIFRDLVLNGVETLLIDAGDFSSQTSERSSKMLHGGIRYLENMDFPLVFEALHEKNLWLKLTPHLTREVPFYMPVYKDSKRPLWMIRIGLFLYDLLSSFKNSPFSMKNRDECVRDIKGLNPEGLSGAGVYYDGIMDDAKITLEVIYDALNEPHAFAINHTKVTNVRKINSKNTLTLKDQLTGEEKNIIADQVVYALGPFTDSFLKQYSFYHWKDVLLPSKGSHIWIRSTDLPIAHPIVMTPQDEYGDRVIFVIPHGEKVLVGTTEVPNKDDLFHVKPTEEEIQYLLKNLNLYFPQSNLTKDKIIGSFAGIRPLVKEENTGGDRGKTSREHKVFQPASDTYVIAGGKYTTFRVMGREITQKICHRFHLSYNQDKTESPLRSPSVVGPFEWHLPSETELIHICEKEMPKTFEDLVVRRLSVLSRAIWKEKTKEDFDTYFNRHLKTLQRYLKISAEDIAKFN
ncbi:glycerol-3-phosphate dehydrogenase [Bacteriovorax stolpii]|uniref:glycerol-3-phosphate dehydrogenase/oxidase n=1 Tax=Bacteriovorax stolpii TaxID=960 RepID=UPI0010ED4202|nr:glycerol-3-phosphate dehydrogenase/oxidase [Bacteriovorax stolpii]TDP52083.1 glycerol-3-phosphate dehydrogenase [Bacteriovorax stolpii]